MPRSTAATRYGNRGGGWATPAPASATSSSRPGLAGSCRRCGAPLARAGACGRLICQAVLTWGDDDWAGQLRMAEARAAAGRPESELDGMARQHAARAERLARLPSSTGQSPQSTGPDRQAQLGDPQ